MRKYLAECFGTGILVFFGCGSVIFCVDGVSSFYISIVFGLAFLTSYLFIGKISGSHINPAVSFAMYLEKKISLKEFFLYCLWQILGSIIACLFLVVIVLQCADLGLGSLASACNGFSANSLTGAILGFAFIVECLITACFVFSYLFFTSKKNFAPYAAFAIRFLLLLLFLLCQYLFCKLLLFRFFR